MNFFNRPSIDPVAARVTTLGIRNCLLNQGVDPKTAEKRTIQIAGQMRIGKRLALKILADSSAELVQLQAERSSSPAQPFFSLFVQQLSFRIQQLKEL